MHASDRFEQALRDVDPCMASPQDFGRPLRLALAGCRKHRSRSQRGVPRPARFDHGVYLDCGCGSVKNGRLVAGVFEDGVLREYLTALGRERLQD
jgi:hypothetical protein